MRIMSIDPGRNGAIAIFEDGELHSIADMPDTTAGLQDLMLDTPAVYCAVIEKPFAGPKMSSRTIAVMFEKYGALKASLQWRDVPVREVRPAEWKKGLGLSSDKSASREMASQMFPAQAHLFSRVKDDGRAEAALIGAYWLTRRRA